MGHWVWRLVKARGNAAGDLLSLLSSDDSSERAKQLVRGLVEAAVERHTHTAELSTAALRDLEAPSSRTVFAVWAVIVEHSCNGMANSRKLWHGGKSGDGGGIAGRLGVCAKTVERALDRLEAAGVIKRWQALPGTPGVVKSSNTAENGAEHCYQSYWVGTLPTALQRVLRRAYTALKTKSPFPPEAVTRPTRAPIPSVSPRAMPRVSGSGAAPPPTHARATERSADLAKQFSYDA